MKTILYIVISLGLCSCATLETVEPGDNGQYLREVVGDYNVTRDNGMTTWGLDEAGELDSGGEVRRMVWDQ